MRLNLSTRMLSIFISVIVVVMGLAVMAMTYFPVSREFNQQSQAELTRNIHLIQSRLDQMCGEYLKIGGMLAQREDLITALSKSDSPRLQQLTRETLAATGVQSLAVIDSKGVIFTPGRVETADAGLHKLAAVKMALAGTSATGCVSVDGDAKVELQAACPVKRGNQVAGCILARRNLTENHWFVDEIKADFSNECTIFAGATRNTTTLVKDGQRIVGTKMDNPEVIATVIDKGSRFLKRNTIMGRSYDTAYWPLSDPERKPAGMLFIGRDLASTNRATQQIFRGVLLSAFLIGGLMVGLGWLMMRALNRQIRSVSDAVGDGASLVQTISHEAAATNQNLAAGAGEQASSLEEASAALEQMTATTQQNAERAGTARQLAEATQGAADHGSEAMRQMEDTIVRIRNASQETAKVIRTIDEIAFQTNLLALNAAVEAARAGEAGKGFAVVAEEVRNLAQRSAVAAKNTEQLLSDAQQQSENGVLVSAEVSRIFRQIVDEIKKLSTLIAEVATASHEQAQGINQISTAIIRVDQVTQTNAAHAAEAAASNEKLSFQAQELGRLANSLVAIVSGCQG